MQTTWAPVLHSRASHSAAGCARLRGLCSPAFAVMPDSILPNGSMAWAVPRPLFAQSCLCTLLVPRLLLITKCASVGRRPQKRLKPRPGIEYEEERELEPAAADLQW